MSKLILHMQADTRQKLFYKKSFLKKRLQKCKRFFYTFFQKGGITIETIQTSIELQDNVTKPLRNMQKAIENVIAGFERMQKISSKAVNTASIQQAKGQINQMSAAMSKAKNSVAQTASSQQKLTAQLTSGGKDTKYGIFNCQFTKFEKSIEFIGYHYQYKSTSRFDE